LPFPLRLPQPLHHELEVRGLDVSLPNVRCGAAASDASKDDAPDPHLVEHRLDQFRLDRDARHVREFVVTRDRSSDCCAPGRSVEPINGNSIPEHVRYAAGKRIEL
jgi:hypothetical protein